MKWVHKIILVLIIITLITIVCKHFYERYILRQEYIKSLDQEKDEYINSFYRSSFKGTLTYIKKYGQNPDKYIIGVTDTLNHEITIGKVEITNFRTAVKGDTILKNPNSFQLEINGTKEKILPVIKYE